MGSRLSFGSVGIGDWRRKPPETLMIALPWTRPRSDDDDPSRRLVRRVATGTLSFGNVNMGASKFFGKLQRGWRVDVFGPKKGS